MVWLRRGFAILTLLLIWQIVVWMNVIPPQYLPPVHTVALALSDMLKSGELLES